MSQTSQEIRAAWDAAHYKKYLVRIRTDWESELVDYIETRKRNGESTREIFLQAMLADMENNKE